MKILALCCFAATAFVLAAASAREADITFSGGNDSPLMLTISEPIEYG